MDDLTLERYVGDPELRREIELAARRERARSLKRFCFFARPAAPRRMCVPSSSRSAHVQGRPA
jgi:hypothetical protein